MSDALASLQALLQSDEDNRGKSLVLLACFILLGSIWVGQAQVLPGVSVSEMNLRGSVDAIQWDNDGTDAVALVSDDDGTSLWAHSGSGGWVAVSCSCTPLSISHGLSGWLVGGEDGFFGFIGQLDQPSVTPRDLSWPEGNPDGNHVVSVSGQLSDGWMVSEGAGGERVVRTWLGLFLSNGTGADSDSIIIDSVHRGESNALVLGHDMSLGNPTRGANGEVLFSATAADRESPQLRLLHLGTGGVLHTVISAGDGPFSDAFDSLVAGGSGVYGVKEDLSVHRILGAPGSTGAVLDTDGILWLADESNLWKMEFGYAFAEAQVLPDGVPTEFSSLSSSGQTISALTANDSPQRVTVDPAASKSVLTSLDALGSLFLLLTLIAVCISGGWKVGRKTGIL
jgi:hypothetical protein